MKMKEKEKEKEKEDLNLALPHDLIVEILLRLPVRSLLRFKCVCTSWLSLISQPQFAKSHFDLAASPTHRLLLKRINHDSEIGSLDLGASLYDDSAVVNLKFPPYIAPDFMTLGSCRGFILLMKKACGPLAGDLIVWNPSTRAHREIPVTYDNWNSWYDPSTRVRQGIPPYVMLLGGSLYGFGYDQSNDDYLLVLIRLGGYEPQVIVKADSTFAFYLQFGGPKATTFSKPRIEVLSVKTNVPTFGYGEEIEYITLNHESITGLFLNQALHWLVMSKTTRLRVVLVFDLVERSLSEIPVPCDLADVSSFDEKVHLRVLGGCLGLCYSGGGDGHEMTDIWIMKEYKVQSSWTKSFVVPESEFLPICFTEGGGVFGSDGSGRFEKYNDEGELFENHAYGQKDKRALKYFDMYRESLLTLSSELSLLEEANEDDWQ